METLRTIIESGAIEHGDADCLVYAPDGRRFSYARLRELVATAASQYRSAGARPGDRIGLLLPNSPEMVVAFLAAAYGGYVGNPLNPRLTTSEIVYILGNSRARILVTDSSHASLAREARSQLPHLENVLSVGDSCLLSNAPMVDSDHGVDSIAPTLDDSAMLLYTSGTTGPSKGAVITHRNLAVNSAEITRWLRLGPSDRFLCVMPLFHANGLVLTLYTPLRLGATMILSDGFHSTNFWETVHRYRPTVFGSVAAMLAMLLNRSDPPRDLRRDSLRYALCGSAPVPVDVIERFEARFGVPVIEGYGLTECTCRATFNPPDRRRNGSIGLPIGNEIRIVADDCHDCGPYERGEIWLRGANVMAGYFDNPAATRAAITADGWLRTNDLAYRDSDGYFFVVGRKTDMILRGGENIYPREIEEVLYRHSDVVEASVYAIPHPLYGEEVAAAVVLRHGATVSVDSLLEHCVHHLAAYKCPKVVRLRTDLPKGPTGKILKSRLREEHERENDRLATQSSPGAR